MSWVFRPKSRTISSGVPVTRKKLAYSALMSLMSTGICIGCGVCCWVAGRPSPPGVSPSPNFSSAMGRLSVGAGGRVSVPAVLRRPVVLTTGGIVCDPPRARILDPARFHTTGDRGTVMLDPYSLADPDAVASPALLFYPQLIRRNLDRAVEVARGPARLRPHVKTHKTREIVRLWLERGVTKHKCATLAEAELLASEGVPDVLIAYPMVGPNCRRLAKLAAKYPRTRFAVTADDPAAVQALSAAL